MNELVNLVELIVKLQDADYVMVTPIELKDGMESLTQSAVQTLLDGYSVSKVGVEPTTVVLTTVKRDNVVLVMAGYSEEEVSVILPELIDTPQGKGPLVAVFDETAVIEDIKCDGWILTTPAKIGAWLFADYDTKTSLDINELHRDVEGVTHIHVPAGGYVAPADADDMEVEVMAEALVEVLKDMMKKA